MKYSYTIDKLKKHYLSEINSCICDLKTKGKRKKQIPNILTASRIIAPIFIIPCAFFSSLPITIGVAGVFALTDMFDGVLARKLHATSNFGKELDPIADKIFACGLIIPLIPYNPIIIINLLLETVISAINLKSKLKENDPKTNMLGKIKTWSLSSLMVVNYCSLFFSLSSTISSILIAVTSILQVSTSIKYFKDDKLKDIKKNEIVENNNSTNISEKSKIHKKKPSVKSKVIDELTIDKNLLQNQNKQLGDYNKGALRK